MIVETLAVVKPGDDGVWELELLCEHISNSAGVDPSRVDISIKTIVKVWADSGIYERDGDVVCINCTRWRKLLEVAYSTDAGIIMPIGMRVIKAIRRLGGNSKVPDAILVRLPVDFI